jgi:signal transduction histidine kinase
MGILKHLIGSHLQKETSLIFKDEFSYLAKAISEMDVQLRNKIEEVSKEKDYLQTILKGMAEGVLFVDEKRHIIMINDTLHKLFSLLEVFKGVLDSIKIGLRNVNNKNRFLGILHGRAIDIINVNMGIAKSLSDLA